MTLESSFPVFSTSLPSVGAVAGAPWLKSAPSIGISVCAVTGGGRLQGSLWKCFRLAIPFHALFSSAPLSCRRSLSLFFFVYWRQLFHAASHIISSFDKGTCFFQLIFSHAFSFLLIFSDARIVGSMLLKNKNWVSASVLPDNWALASHSSAPIFCSLSQRGALKRPLSP